MSTQSIQDRIDQLWSAARSKWDGPAANAFYQQYILRMKEVGNTFEQASNRMEQQNQAFEEMLASIEQQMM